MILFNVKEPEQQEEKPETTQAEVIQNPETMTQMTESIEDKYKVFDTMSEDWGSDDLEGFVFYDLPEKYADKGYFPEKMQIYTRCLCKQNDVPYALILAIIEYESGYEFDKTGDNGNSKGYMQIYEKWHTDRMQKLNCTDLMNPYQNVKVGIDFLSYLLKKYGTVQDALAAYNYGERGAREHLWNCFISSRFSLDSRLMSLMSSAMFSSFTTTIVSFSARLSVSSCVSFLSFLCFEQIPKKIANATDTPEISKETSIVNGVLLSELCRLDVVGVAVFPHVIFENIHLPVCLLYLLPEFRSDRLLDFRLFNDCLLFFHDCR